MTGIVFYSKNNNTKTLAELLAEKYEGRIIELKEEQKRNGLFGFLKSGFQASKRIQSKLINTPWDEITDCKKLYLCSPIWAGKTTPAMNTFIANADLNNKGIVLVNIMADPDFKGLETEQEYISDIITKKGGTVEKSVAINGASPFQQCDKLHIKRQFNTEF